MNKNRYLLLSVLLILFAVYFLPQIKLAFHRPPSGKTEIAAKPVRQIGDLVDNNVFANTSQNIILITIDTLRADHLGCYGYKDIMTPNIDKLAAEGVLFYNAIAVSPSTSVSHSSIFTGLYPYKHGVRANGSFYMDDDNLTLAEILKENGYTTAGFIGAYVLHSKFNISQGFDYYDEEFPGTTTQKSWLGHKYGRFERRADEVTDNFLRWLIKNKKKKFFAWVHYFDPHYPYNPPIKYRTQSSASKLYDGEITFVDECIGYILKYVRSLKTDNNTSIIITSDHGESLGERGYRGHGMQLYDNALRVPLIFYPGIPQVIKKQVRSIDIMPTILDMVNIESPPNIQGESLLPMTRDASRGGDTVALSEAMEFYLRLKQKYMSFSIRTDNWKIIKHHYPADNGQKMELYDLLADPDEENNLIGSTRPRRLSERLDRYINSSKRIDMKSARPLTDNTKKALKALGYIQ